MPSAGTTTPRVQTRVGILPAFSIITPYEIDRDHDAVYARRCRSGLRGCEADEGRGCGRAVDGESAGKAPAAPQLCGGTKPARATVSVRMPGARMRMGRRRE